MFKTPEGERAFLAVYDGLMKKWRAGSGART